MFARLRIGRKLFLINLLSGLIMIGAAGGMLVWRNHASLMEQFRERIRTEAQLVSVNVQAAVLFEDWENAEQIARALMEDSAVRRASIEGSGGEALVEIRNPLTGAGEPLRLRVPIVDGELVLAYLQVEASDEEVWRTSREAILSIFAMTLIACVAGMLVSSRVQRVVTQPIERLSELTRRVQSTQEYSHRAEVVFPDEVGTLTDNLNQMLSLIEARDRHLEDLVEERTAELRAEMEQRQQADLARAESQQRFEQAFHNAPIGMAVIAQGGLFTQRNAMFDMLLGTREKAILDLEDVIAAEDFESVAARFRKQVEGRLPEFSCECRCRKADGRTIYAQLSLAQVRGENDIFLYSVLQLQDVTQAKELADELHHQARHDVLTGLANRRTLQADLQEASRRCLEDDRKYSLCILDLDQFKIVNDTSGHAAGDALLSQVSEVLRDHVREDDTVARLGGDEFALLLQDCGPEKAFDIATRIRIAIEELVFHWEGRTHHIGVSIGVVCVTEGGGNTSDVLQRADAACFAAKEAGRNQVHLARETSTQVDAKRGEMHWVQRIHTALDQNDFLLYVQPVKPLKGEEEDERLEVLLRMRNRATGMLVPPGAFLPAAERYDLSVKIDRWVVDTLLRTASVYRELFAENRSYWINLTGASLSDEAFMVHVYNAVKAADLPPGTINFEITETAVVRNVAEAAKVMRGMRELGCRFALDDFGKGLSSFGYLKTLPVDHLKIDGMFIRDIARDPIDRMFVKSIIDIANAMRLKTVAEFVENDEILEHVKALGADYGQGFGLGRPRPLLPFAANSLLARNVV
ncbi:MAG: EAL domain-containing protein [Pseudomonadales bacterium]|nr:EAL domain-containing protein [Pseudomonadales bacterium]